MPRARNEWWLYVDGNYQEAVASLKYHLPQCRILDSWEMAKSGETAFVIDVEMAELREVIRAWQARSRREAEGPGRLSLVSKHDPRAAN